MTTSETLSGLSKTIINLAAKKHLITHFQDSSSHTANSSPEWMLVLVGKFSSSLVLNDSLSLSGQGHNHLQADFRPGLRFRMAVWQEIARQ
jgi:hypothetical protein